ncbi:protein-glutamine gamma-glutamyltransferase E-like isoform X2 [Rana temporaria]|uniref:protein-glutamine gamma-glutamyltransferase E-like isoform X2 n=1 Tax=Rana temporaria TaxID=8407 RepID=UPI001AAC7CE3|nr:protein-glutamine gamma-glutamyltransferase E-like isoform X2 [Rana temporaria]
MAGAGSGLQLTNYDLQVQSNKSKHNCDSYMGNDLVVRRGQEFNITMQFNAPVKAGDRLQFTASLVPTTGANSVLDNTFTDSTSPSPNSWGAQRGSSESTSVNITIFPPNNAAIGRYVLYLTSGVARRIGEFFLIFNPWASGDMVYLADQAQRQEYVLSEFGLIFGGDVSSPAQFPWNYGQFQAQILYIAFVLLDSTLSFRRNATEDVRKRNDPLHVCRNLSAIINSKDDNGVVMGDWSGDYSGGTNPSAWNGSTSILKSWYERRQSVKYGQCWVFAGVLCTVSRALGLPCRVISNYNSAHDANGDLLIDKYFDVSGEPVMLSDDSVWNFHCWNEFWCIRPDLGSSYNGWQIYDSTPQETSDGIFQLGPTSQVAIKQGDVNKQYDTVFAFSEVNADVNYYTVQTNGSKSKYKTETAEVGVLICTKALGSNVYEDITHMYKFQEGTSKEREIFRKAQQIVGVSSGFTAFSADGSADSTPDREQDVSGAIIFSGTPQVGEDITAILTLTNLKPTSKNVTCNISVAAVVYTNAVRRSILKKTVNVQLNPNEVKEIPILVKYSEYEKALTTDSMIQVTAVCQVEGWGDLMVEGIITLKKPNLIVQTPGTVEVGKSTTIEVKFTNPLQFPVNNCVLTAEGSGLIEHEVKKSVGTLEPGKTMTVTMDIKPFASGHKHLLLNLSSDRFKDIKEFVALSVSELAS